jgi:hypothetical protein
VQFSWVSYLFENQQYFTDSSTWCLENNEKKNIKKIATTKIDLIFSTKFNYLLGMTISFLVGFSFLHFP